MQFSIKISDEELETHEWLKEFFGFEGMYGEDSQTIKQAERTCKMVLLNTFGNEMKEIFQRRSKDALSKFREENPPNPKKGTTQTDKTDEKGSAKPSFRDIIFN
jgi:hypothetical protein